MVENAHCEDFGLDIPETFETCGNEDCPTWVKGEWSSCYQSRCHGRNTALQRRDVSCRFPNNTIAKSCADYQRPVAKQECYNERCKGVWRVEPWSEVSQLLAFVNYFNPIGSIMYTCATFALLVVLLL